MKKLTSYSAILLAGFHLSANAQRLTLAIQDNDGKPLNNAVVKVHDTAIKTQANANGLAELDLSPGQYTIDIEWKNGIHFHQVVVLSASDQYDDNNRLVISLKEEPGHKLVIHANPLEHTALDMATPIILLAGDELTSKKAGTLGEILQQEPGLSVSSFGPAVSRPVIRGLSGSRVKITNNQMSVMDASTNSADHDVGMEPLLAEQVEVVKGPATLLYGSGAIGGVVNVTDRKINPTLVDGVTGGLEFRLGDSATEQQTTVFTLDGGTQNWNWHVDGFSSESSDIEIPGFAESAAFRELEEQEEHEEGEEEHEEEHEDEHHEDEVEGVLENSFSETTGFNLGTTLLISDTDYIGFSVGKIDKEYGVPGHAHHEEEEEHEEEEHEEEHHEEEGVSIDMQQTRYDLQAQFEAPIAGIETFFAGASYTDYEHREIEGDEIGTLFTNKASEFRSYAKHSDWDGWSGVIGLQVNQRDFTAEGDEAIIPASETDSWALFWLEEKSFGDLKWELGSRYEKQTIKTDTFADVDADGLSFSIGGVYSLAKHNKLALNFSHAERFASVEELFVDGAHLATRSYEIGNSELNNETSNNLDFSYRFENDSLRGEFNLYWNDFSDFIYAENVTAADGCASAEAIEVSEEEELLTVCYKQQDATFKGAEIQVELPIGNWDGHELSLDIFADTVIAELTNNDDLPRMPADKSGLQINYDYLDWSANVSWVHHSKQSRLGANELTTAGFDMLNLEAAYRLPMRDKELFIFLKGQNLLDEEARDHSSFIKDLAPRAGRNLVIGARYTF
jgi:iron complex outermembrane receptor protein